MAWNCLSTSPGKAGVKNQKKTYLIGKAGEFPENGLDGQARVFIVYLTRRAQGKVVVLLSHCT